MIVSLGDLTSAINKIKKIAEGRQNVPGVLFDINGDKMKVCYADGKRALVEILDIQPGEADVQGQIVVPYEKIVNFIDICQATDRVYTSDINIEFEDEQKIISLTALKQIDVIGMGESNVEARVVGKVQQKMSYADPKEKIQYQLLSRMDYDSIFESTDADIWNREELRRALSRTATEKNKVVYFSHNRHSAFVVNLAHVTNIPTPSCEKYALSIATGLANQLDDILGKMNGDTISLQVIDNRYCSLVSEDGTVGIWFELAPPSRTDIFTLQRYEEKQYNQYLLTFCKPALQNVIACAAAVESNEKTLLKFGETETGEMAIKITGMSGGASVMNDFSVVMDNYRDNVGNLKDTQIPVNLKVLYSILSNCESVYVAMDIAVDENAIYIRIGDILEADESGYATRFGAVHYTIAAK